MIGFINKPNRDRVDRFFEVVRLFEGFDDLDVVLEYINKGGNIFEVQAEFLKLRRPKKKHGKSVHNKSDV